MPRRSPTLTDTLVICGIVVECRIGVEEWERAVPQTIWIDLELAIDVSRAARRDDVRETVDYSQLVMAVKRLAQRQPYRLLETLTEAIASLILEAFGVARVRVRVKKRALSDLDYAAVEIQRCSAAPPRVASPSGSRRQATKRRWS